RSSLRTGAGGRREAGPAAGRSALWPALGDCQGSGRLPVVAGPLDPVNPAQNASLALNWICRFSFTSTDCVPRAVVTWPKVADPNALRGRSKCGVFDRLKDSPRSSKYTRSVIRKRRKIEASISNRRGPCSTFRPTLPSVLGAGAENTDVSK